MSIYRKHSPHIVHRIRIKAPLAKVYAAVTTIEGIAGWWTRETTGSSALGSIVNARFTGNDEEIWKSTFEMMKLEPHKCANWRIRSGPDEWIGTDVTFDLSQDGDMTLVQFGYRNWPKAEEFTSHCSMLWA